MSFAPSVRWTLAIATAAIPIGWVFWTAVCVWVGEKEIGKTLRGWTHVCMALGLALAVAFQLIAWASA